MSNRQKKNKTARFVACIFMMLALAWLTVSLPVVFAAQQKTVELSKSVNTDNTSKNNEDKSNNPLANTTEEKTCNGGNSLSEEYLHDTHSHEYHFNVLSIKYNIEHFSTYIAFYGELISPPPDLS